MTAWCYLLMFILCEYVCVWGGICVYLYMGTMHIYVYIVCIYREK